MKKYHYIKISGVSDGEFYPVVECYFLDLVLANQVYNSIENEYSLDPTYTDDDYLIDLYIDDHLESTFITNIHHAAVINGAYFGGLDRKQLACRVVPSLYLH
jgi:hypothetical protein